ncbi:MAG: alpha/beta hydrolase [Chloroflexi bacterium]|nr:alpha/beta hydrolase [Chloroflexota bacterium]
MKKILLLTGGVLLLALIAGGAWFWNEMQKPLYQPGMVRAGTNLRASLTPPAQPADENFWQVENDIRLYHFSDGTGANVLVVHGGPGFPFSAPPSGLAQLNDRYRLQYYDQRGSGKSSRPIDTFASSNYYENMQTLDRTLGLGAQIADIERIRQILGDEKLILVGHSFGGFLAALYAAEFPEHVQALVLVAPAETLVMPSESGGLFEQVRPLLPAEMKSEYDAYLKRYLDYGALFAKNEQELVALNNEFARYYSAALKARGLSLPQESSSAEPGGWMVHALYMSMGLRHDYRDALKRVTAPVLVIHGQNDLQPEKASRSYVETFPNAEFRVIANAGHFVFTDQPDAFAQSVGEFLDKVQAH